MLAEARSELMKQQNMVESLHPCIGDFSGKLLLSGWNWRMPIIGYEESRREQVRLQEALVMREKALGDSQIRSIHEMGELRRAQELRVDEFSVQKLRESHDTIQRLTSQDTRVAREGELDE